MWPDRRLLDLFKTEFPIVHILVNNAGGPIRRMDRQITWPDSDWVDDINLKAIGMLRVIQAFLPSLPKDGNGRIIVGEILPNALPPVIVLSSLVVAGAILFESAVSFLGLGDPNVASWGRLVGDGRQLIRSSWYICAIPGVAIMVTVLCLNLIGDGLNDALNPKLRDR